jgi:RimJ/RimL family protein N-acetyltransferase
MVELPNPWPLWHLVLRTPRLELRPDDDQGLAELMAEACRGVHPPDQMPFGVPWTDAPPTEMVRNGMRFYWSQRATLAPDDWTINFLIRHNGQVIGCQALHGRHFPTLREVSTGSWLGRRHQGLGLGKEMRAAVLAFAFDHLGAETARSSAYTDNRQSNGVSRSLGYQPDGTFADVRRGTRATQTRLLLTKQNFARPDWRLDVKGTTEVRQFLTIPE